MSILICSFPYIPTFGKGLSDSLVEQAVWHMFISLSKTVERSIETCSVPDRYLLGLIHVTMTFNPNLGA